MDEMIEFPVCLGQRPLSIAMEYLYAVPTETDWKSDYGLLITVWPSGFSIESVLDPATFQNLLHQEW